MIDFRAVFASIVSKKSIEAAVDTTFRFSQYINTTDASDSSSKNGSDSRYIIGGVSVGVGLILTCILCIGLGGPRGLVRLAFSRNLQAPVAPVSELSLTVIDPSSAAERSASPSASI